MTRDDRPPRLYDRKSYLMKYDEDSVFRALDVHARAGRIDGWTRRDDGKIAVALPVGGLWLGTVHQAHHLSLGLTVGSEHERRVWQAKVKTIKETLG